MIVGENSRSGDMDVNPTKEKKLTNIRTHSHDESLRLTPARPITLESALEFISGDELVEVTPAVDPAAQARPVPARPPARGGTGGGSQARRRNARRRPPAEVASRRPGSCETSGGVVEWADDGWVLAAAVAALVARHDGEWRHRRRTTSARGFRPRRHADRSPDDRPQLLRLGRRPGAPYRRRSPEHVRLPRLGMGHRPGHPGQQRRAERYARRDRHGLEPGARSPERLLGRPVPVGPALHHGHRDHVRRFRASESRRRDRRVERLRGHVGPGHQHRDRRQRPGTGPQHDHAPRPVAYGVRRIPRHERQGLQRGSDRGDPGRSRAWRGVGGLGWSPTRHPGSSP